MVGKVGKILRNQILTAIEARRINTNYSKFTMRNSNYRNKKNRTKSPYVRLGYHDKVDINGTVMYLRDASKDHPHELFALIDKKQIWVAERVYKNLLDYMRVVDVFKYEAHRRPYHDKVVLNTKIKQYNELDYVVRAHLVGCAVSKVSMVVGSRMRNYSSSRLLDSPSLTSSFTFVKCSTGFALKSSN